MYMSFLRLAPCWYFFCFESQCYIIVENNNRQ